MPIEEIAEIDSDEVLISKAKSLRDFIYESNRRGNIFFVATVAEARLKLSVP